MDVQAQFQRRGFFNGIAQHHIVDSVGDICVYHKQDMGISKQGKGLCKNTLQALSFYAARLFTLFVDLIIMFLLVNLPGIENGLYEFCAKVFSNIVVLVLNYVSARCSCSEKRRRTKKTRIRVMMRKSRADARLSLLCCAVKKDACVYHSIYNRTIDSCLISVVSICIGNYFPFLPPSQTSHGQDHHCDNYISGFYI